MELLLTLRREIEKIRAAVDEIEVKGSKNRVLATYAFEKCSQMIDLMDKLEKQAEEAGNNEQNNQ